MRGARLALLLLFACGPDTGSPGGANPGSVSGTAFGADFSFTAAAARATFVAASSSEGQLTLSLCDDACPELGSAAPPPKTVRAFSVTITAPTTDLRTGTTVRIGPHGTGSAFLHQPGSTQNDDAVAGEVVIESSNLTEGGATVGSFQVDLRSGGALSGFFNATTHLMGTAAP